MTIVTREVYVHSTSNPPLFDRSVDAEITISNSKYLKLTNWAKAQQQTQYTLKISNPKDIGLHSAGQNSIEKFIEEILLGLNLSLTKGAFLTYRADMNPTRIELEQESIESKIEKRKNNTKIMINETIIIRDSYHLTQGFKETVDEIKVLQILDKITKLENMSSQGLKINELKKSLEEYKMAMSTFHRISIFKHLFTAMELAVNSDGKDRMGKRLDSEILILGNISDTSAKQWREFNDRVKHVDSDLSKEAKYVQGMNDLPQYIRPLRESCSKIIQIRLTTL